MKKVLLKAKYAGYKPWRVLPLEDDEADGIVARGIAEYVIEEQPEEVVKPDPELITFEAFSEMQADGQKECLKRLNIEGDDSNKEKRVALYAAYLAGELNDGQSGNGTDGGTGNAGGSESTPTG